MLKKYALTSCFIHLNVVSINEWMDGCLKRNSGTHNNNSWFIRCMQDNVKKMKLISRKNKKLATLKN